MICPDNGGFSWGDLGLPVPPFCEYCIQEQEERERRGGMEGSFQAMALNYSSCSFLLNDECTGMMQGCGCRSEEASPLSSCGVNSLWWDELELELELEEFDPVDLLPTDPFGMNLETTFAASIASCIGDLTAMSGTGHFGSGSCDAVFADLSYYLNQAFALSPEPLIGSQVEAFGGPFGFGGLPGGLGADHSPGLPPCVCFSQFIGFVDDASTSANATLFHDDAIDAVSGVLPTCASCPQYIEFVEDASISANAALACNDTVDAVLENLPPHASCSQFNGFLDDTSTSGNAALACLDTVDAVPVQEGSDPHEGMVYALGYLGLRDILSIEMVCKSLYFAVRSDPLLWRSIHIEPWLNKKIFDTDLLCLTRKSQGALQSLCIVGCINITDQGLKAVLESNLRLTKLTIIGCVRLTLGGFISNLKSFNMKAVAGIKYLRVGNLFSLQKEHYEELLSLLSIDNMQEVQSQEPQFIHANHLLSDCNDGYALDIQMCPVCQYYKPVYDCPAEGCNERKSGKCRACEVCILRCQRCGRCVQNLPYEETFDFDCLCYYCERIKSHTS